MRAYSNEFLEETIKIWQPHSTEDLSLEDARAITENIVELFTFLGELENKYAKKN